MSKPIISLKNVSKTYQMDGIQIKALKSTTLQIRQGEFVAIIGPSGSGKSTLMHLIGALDTPTTGTITIQKKDISRQKEASLAKIRNQSIGFVFQQFNLLSKTSAVYNVEIPLIYAGQTNASKRRQKAIKLLKQIGLEDRLNNHPNQLSGGQQQRVAIARALINNPAIILADEPTGNLDTKTGKEILDIFVKLNKLGKTIIIVTHEPAIAKKAKRQIKIIDGQLV